MPILEREHVPEVINAVIAVNCGPDAKLKNHDYKMTLIGGFEGLPGKVLIMT